MTLVSDAMKRRRSAKRELVDATSLDFTRITHEAGELAPGPLGFLLWLDEQATTRAGVPRLSPWWRAELARFYAANTAQPSKRWLLVLAGRGAGKSTTLTKIAVSESIFTPRTVPAGERWIWPFISVGPEDANRRIDGIADLLRAIGLEVKPVYSPRAKIETVDARGNAIAFMSLASTISNVSGPSTIGAVIDEEAKLLGRERSVNPSGEILTALAATFRARPNIRAVRCSSAWAASGSHYSAIQEGDNDAVHVARLGAAFVGVARAGFLDVASWEQAHGDPAAANSLRDYADKLHAHMTSVPTWCANPSIGAVASRVDAQVTPREALGGTSRLAYWMREIGSVVVTPGAFSGAVPFTWGDMPGPKPLGSVVVGPSPADPDLSASFTPSSAALSRLSSRRTW